MTKTMSKILLEKLALEKMLDYKFESTFWEEFSIAEDYGVDDSIGKMYDQLWKEADGYALNTLKSDDLHYYLSTLD